MKHSWVYFLFLLLVSSSVMVTQNTVNGALPILVTPNPADGGIVSTDLVYLQVRVTSRRENVEDCLIKFYIDGVFYEQKTTNELGLTLVDVLPTWGNHTWYVVADKPGYDRYVSPTFSFRFHPVRELTVESLWGNTYGSGVYPIEDIIEFGVNPAVIYSGGHTRFVFKEWRSYDEGGYSGYMIEWFVPLINDIKEVAIWETQHFVEFKTEGYGTISLKSDWYSAGSILDVFVESGQEHFFTLWEGNGGSSYTGDLNDIQIQVLSPIIQTAYFNTEDGTLLVVSDYGKTSGTGLYQQGETAEFGVKPKIYYIDDNTRYVFSGWTSISEFGYKGKEQNASILMETSIIQKAEWTKQYNIKIEATDGGSVSKESGWYEEGEMFRINATPGYGYDFVRWLDGDDVNLSYKEEYEVNLSSTLSLWAEFLPKKKHTLSIVSDYADLTQEISYFDDELVQLSVPKMVEDGDTRYLFQEWTCNTSSGYTGLENNASYVMTESITQYASWLTEYYVTSSDPQIAGWYEENHVIQLEPEDTGMFSRETKYEVNGENISNNFVTVIEPLSIESYTTFNYSVLLIVAAVLVLIIIGVVTVRAITE